MIEFQRDDKWIAEGAQLRPGLTAPEISVLPAYSKITLKETILASTLPDAPSCGNCWSTISHSRWLVNRASNSIYIC